MNEGRFRVKAMDGSEQSVGFTAVPQADKAQWVLCSGMAASKSRLRGSRMPRQDGRDIAKRTMDSRPVDRSYKATSNVTHARELRGALVLIVGDLDINIDPASTMQDVNALNEARQGYEFLFLPSGGDCAGFSSQFTIQRPRDSYVTHLIGMERMCRNGQWVT